MWDKSLNKLIYFEKYNFIVNLVKCEIKSIKTKKTKSREAKSLMSNMCIRSSASGVPNANFLHLTHQTPKSLLDYEAFQISKKKKFPTCYSAILLIEW